ncbi:MAG: TetR/AcrR family transcriptional regulator C-terminal domain-containing protein [Stackebrandtia sp.]
MSLTRDDIVREALELFKADGLDALSLRKLAARLNVSAPTLYWHVANKRELLDLVATELVRTQVLLDAPDPGQPWWEWLRVRTTQMFHNLVEIRDAPRVLAGNRPSLDDLARLDSTLKVLIDAGIPAGDAQQIYFSIGSYVVGSVVEWQAEADRAREGVGTDPQVVAALRDRKHPNIAAAMNSIAGLPHHAAFDFGLNLLIDGLRSRYVSDIHQS